MPTCGQTNETTDARTDRRVGGHSWPTNGHIAFLYNHKWILELRSVIEIRGDYLNVLGSLIGFPASGIRVQDDKSQSHDSRKVIHWEDFWDESQSQESSTDN